MTSGEDETLILGVILGIPILNLLFYAVDYFLISVSLHTQIDQCDISPGFKTDHSSVDVRIISANERRGRGFLKFNVSLLNDIDYVNKIKQCIHDANAKCNYMNPNML